MKSPHNQESDSVLIEKKRPSCKTCDAPLCPLDEDIGHRQWFPDEPICKVRESGGLVWIRNQRKVKKRALDDSRYFTLEMLRRNCVIRGGIKGLSPDLPCNTEEKRIQKWLAKHPPRRTISGDEREKLAERMKRLRDLRK